MNTETDRRYDVVIYRESDREITTITGEGLRLQTGFYNAEKRLETTLSRLNELYWAEIVPAGQFKVGDKLPEEIPA